MPGYSYQERSKKMADSKKEDSWFGIYWKPAAAVIYLTICLFDFVAVPTYLGLGSDTLPELILAVKDLPADSQNIVLTMKLASWEPLTLKGGGLFHIAFGAILGATVWSRGQERINEIRQGWGGPDLSDPYGSQSQGQFSAPAAIVQPVNNNVQNRTAGQQIDNPDEENG